MLLSNWPKFTLKLKADLKCLTFVFNTEVIYENTLIANNGKQQMSDVSK